MNCFYYKLLEATAVPPKRYSDLAAGMDLHSLEDVELKANDFYKIRTGLSLVFPDGHYGRIASRSGLAAKGIVVLGGVVDPDYTGEIFIVLYNHGKKDYKINAGDRIAQIICEKYCTPKILPIEECSGKNLSEWNKSKRQNKGFGSSGI